MEAQFDDELRLLANALRQEAFRFILIGHNRFSLYKDIADWLRNAFTEASFSGTTPSGKRLSPNC